ncbi:endonuclease V [Duganella sp. Root1480D1]|uniref:endonuclease V n=1 Tax=Duganella sp. Root1480D1 TaxID=1736471 RepID=UPI000708C235|nr:endonuclease V [Duganella sp. Root1480D1]KQZ42658.1 endonuclease V [Duganella sp. Root1480D1]
MLLAVDVQYRDDCGFAAGVLFQDWLSERPLRTVSARVDGIGEYVPGEFYKRELPCILKLLEGVDEQIDCIVIDGFVFLDDEARPGLGKHLFDALAGRYPIVGVAKTSFAGIGKQYEVLRGDSKRPLYVTTAGYDLVAAKRHIAAMHGEHRMPTVLKLVDQCCRGDAMMASEVS